MFSTWTAAVRGVIDVATDQDKLRLARLSWDWTGPALGVILLGAVFNNLVPYSSDQAVVQRYLTTRDEKRRAARAVWTGALLSVPASLSSSSASARRCSSSTSSIPSG